MKVLSMLGSQSDHGAHKKHSRSTSEAKKKVCVVLNDKETSEIIVPVSMRFGELLEQVENDKMVVLKQDTYKLLNKSEKKTPAVKWTDALSDKKFEKLEKVELLLSPPAPLTSKTRVFGADLLGVMKRQRERRPNAKLNIPVCIDMCFKFLRDRYLDELGLFRLSGSLRQINNLIKKFNCEMEEQFSDSLDPHVVTGLVKRYLRDLQNPLLTFDAYSHIKSLFSSEMNFEERIVKLRTIIHNLPMDHYNLLETLFAFLVLVATKHPATKMSTENLSIVIGPNILVAPESSGFVSDMDTTSVVCNTCVLMIDHYSQIFKNTSPFDSSLLGLNDLQADQIITLNKEPKRQASQDPAQMSPQTRSSSTRLFAKGDTHKGHIPKGVYVPNKNKKDKELVFYLHQVRLTGESLVCLDEKPTEDNVDVQQFVVEREVPYDFLREVSPVSQHPTATEYHLLTITYIYKKEKFLIHIMSNDQTELEYWKNELDHIHTRYAEFIQRANEQPEMYGIIITKEQFKQAKEQKQRHRSVLLSKSVESSISTQASSDSFPEIATPVQQQQQQPSPTIQLNWGATTPLIGSDQIQLDIHEDLMKDKGQKTVSVPIEEWRHLQFNVKQYMQWFEQEQEAKQALQAKVTVLETRIKQLLAQEKKSVDTQQQHSHEEEDYESDSTDSQEFR